MSNEAESEHAKNAKTLLGMAKKGIFSAELTNRILDDSGRFLRGRYLVVLRLDYGGERDEMEWDMWDTLDGVKESVENHLFEERGLDYEAFADVYDLTTHRMVGYDVVQEIRWK